MAKEKPSGYIRKENPHKNEEPVPFTDKDRRAVAQRLEAEKEKADLLKVFEEALFGSQLDERQKALDRQEATEKHHEMSDLLTGAISGTIEDEAGTYAFITKIGEEPFDARIISQVAASFVWRLHNLKEKRRYLEGEDWEYITRRARHRTENSAAYAYKHHIPAYTEMFKELDARDVDTEIYLGRDAVFMYYARRAQLWGRGGSRKVIYLNYSTYLKETPFTVEERRRYLRERGIKDVARAVFVDTGYVGSIPEHLLREVYGVWDQREIDKRILLIQSDAVQRMPRLSFRHQRTNISPIEAAPKLTRPAEGLYENRRTGKLEPVSSPTSVMEVLEHETIKYLCMRHFYLLGKQQKAEAPSEES